MNDLEAILSGPDQPAAPDVFETAGRQYGVDPRLLRAISQVESANNPAAVSPKGAQGQMQIMPPTAKGLGVRNAFDPNQAIPGAAKLLAQNQQQFGGWDRAVLAYHGGTDPKAWGPKTQDYLKKVSAAYAQLGGSLDPDDLAAILGGHAAANAPASAPPSSSASAPPASSAPAAPIDLGKWASGLPQVKLAGGGPGDTRVIRYPDGSPVTKAQQAWYEVHASKISQDAPGLAGTAQDPYFIPPGGQAPLGPNVHWVDASGVHHLNPGGLSGQAGSFASGLWQSAVQGLASLNKLTGGGLASGEGSEFSYLHGGPSAPEMADASLRAFSQQQQRYNAAHIGDPAAGAGNFLGQLGLGTAASLAFPEIELPEAAGIGLKIGANALTNAGRGVAATVPSLANSDAPVADQLLGGAVTGALLPPVLNKASEAGMRLASGGGSVPDAVAKLADTAINKYGIPLRSSQILGSVDRNAAVRDSQLISAPGSGFASNNAAQKTAFTRAVAKTFGENADALTPDVMARAKARIGDVFDTVAGRTNIAKTDGLLTNLGKVAYDAQQVLPDNEVAPLLRQIENIGSTIRGGALSGDSYQALTRKGSPLDLLEGSSNPNVRYYGSQIRGALDDALEDFASADDLSDLRSARWQYKNLMTVKDLAAKAGVTGEISPLLLSGAVNRSFKGRAFSGAGDLGELSQIGQAFMKEPPNSGTPSRLAEMFKASVLPAAAGGEGALLLLHQPELALQLGLAGAGAAGLRYGSNAVRGVLNNNSLVTNALLRGPDAGIPKTFADIANFTRPAQIPLGALTVNSLFNPPTPIGANAQ